MMENGQLAAKKFSIDWPDCILQAERNVKFKLKTLPALQALIVELMPKRYWKSTL